MLEGIVVPLGKPVHVLTGMVSSFTLRDPTGKDMAEAGYPTRFDSVGNTTIDARVMTRFIARLAGVPVTAVEEMSGADWNRCALEVMDFLGGGAAESSS
jgi:hypothetical protein